MAFTQPGTEGFERKNGALKACGRDVAFESSDETIVGDIRQCLNVGAEDQLSEKRGGGGADSTSIAFEAGLRHNPILESYFDSDSIAAQRIETLVADIRLGDVSVIARMSEVVQENVTVQCGHSSLPA
jgi:hypothetical protein